MWNHVYVYADGEGLVGTGVLRPSTTKFQEEGDAIVHVLTIV